MEIILGVVVTAIISAIAIKAILETNTQEITMSFVKQEVNDKLKDEKVAKVAVMDMKVLMVALENKKSIDKIDADLCIVSIDNNNNVFGNVSFYKNDKNEMDIEVTKMLGNEGMIVIEG